MRHLPLTAGQETSPSQWFLIVFISATSSIIFLAIIAVSWFLSQWQYWIFNTNKQLKITNESVLKEPDESVEAIESIERTEKNQCPKYFHIFQKEFRPRKVCKTDASVSATIRNYTTLQQLRHDSYSSRRKLKRINRQLSTEDNYIPSMPSSSRYFEDDDHLASDNENLSVSISSKVAAEFWMYVVIKSTAHRHLVSNYSEFRKVLQQ